MTVLDATCSTSVYYYNHSTNENWRTTISTTTISDYFLKTTRAISRDTRMNKALLILMVVAFIISLGAAGDPPPIVWWHLVKVIDERTLSLRSDKGETRTIKLACIGHTDSKTQAMTYIERRCRDQKLVFWPLETGEESYASPMCLILDMGLPGGLGGEAVYDFPLLNEELLAWGRTPYEDVKVTGDKYGLKARLVKAKEEWAARENARKERRKNPGAGP